MNAMNLQKHKFWSVGSKTYSACTEWYERTS